MIENDDYTGKEGHMQVNVTKAGENSVQMPPCCLLTVNSRDCNQAYESQN